MEQKMKIYKTKHHIINEIFMRAGFRSEILEDVGLQPYILEVCGAMSSFSKNPIDWIDWNREKLNTLPIKHLKVICKKIRKYQ